MFVLDSHCDTPSQIHRLRNLALDNDHAHIDFPKLKRGGVDGSFFALYIPASLDSDPEKAFAYASCLYSDTMRCLEANQDKARLAVSREQALENKAAGLFSVFLGLENGSAIGDSFERLNYFYSKGIRYITLCHSANNQICDSCATAVKRWGGLSPFGKELVVRMNRMGMLVDVSHISDDAFYDVLECSEAPVVATHSCCRALSDHPRNMTDQMIKSLAESGGVIQVNFYPLFLDARFSDVLADSGLSDMGERIETEFIADPADLSKRKAWYSVMDSLSALKRPDYTLIADHIDHVVEIAGIDHVGIGSDFDGIAVTPKGLEDVSMVPKIFDELRRRGYTESDLSKIASDNFFRCMKG